MPDIPEEAEVLAQLVGWGESEERVRALILTSSRARADESVDDLSDYDVIVAVRDVERFVAAERWMEARGRPLARWGDEHELLGAKAVFRGAVYPDGVKVDFTIWPEALLERVRDADALPDALDVGYRVLLDKDGRTAGWASPTYCAHVPARPGQAEYDAVVEELWWSATYVAKALWRGEVLFATFVLEHDLKLGALRRMLEWRIELDHAWALRPGAYGRGLERLLPADVLDELSRTVAGADVEADWGALFRTTALFRRVAREVADALDLRYPIEVDEGITAQLEAVRLRAARR